METWRSDFIAVRTATLREHLVPAAFVARSETLPNYRYRSFPPAITNALACSTSRLWQEASWRKPDPSSPNQRNHLFSGQISAETGILWWKKVGEMVQTAGFLCKYTKQSQTALTAWRCAESR